jgi:predicted nucleotidyltransferase
MIEKSTIREVLSFFFDNPSNNTHLRELCRQTKLSMPTIISSTNTLSKEKLIIKEKGIVVTSIKANRENINFIRLKRIYNLEKIYSSGLVDLLSKECNIPKAIICFGSYSRGEDNEKSDIDIALVDCKEKEISLDKFEKIFKRSISLHFIDLKKVSEEFKSNLYNGIILDGAL